MEKELGEDIATNMYDIKFLLQNGEIRIYENIIFNDAVF